MRTTWKRRILYPVGLAIGALLSWKVQGKEPIINEDEIAATAGFVVFNSALTWDPLMFLAFTENISSKSLMKTITKLVDKNIASLKDAVDKKDFITEIDTILAAHSNPYGPDNKLKSDLFKKDSSLQAMKMYSNDILKERTHISKDYQAGSVILLKEYIKKLANLSKEDQARIWKEYKSVIDTTLNAMKQGKSVVIAMKASIREFNLLIKKTLTNIGVPAKEFAIEKARLNLGGSIYSPGLLVQIVSDITDPDKKVFLRSLVSALLSPVEALKNRVSGKSLEEVKSEIIQFIKASNGTSAVHSLKSLIDTAYNLRSESICRRTKNLSNAKTISQEIDLVQGKNTARMLSVLQSADPSLFKDFITLDHTTAKTYIAMVENGGNDQLQKQSIEEHFKLV
ncbi:hypothetical protein NEOKW01_0591 [Nematocida sp. AWRm80]|nr:hypothetical protein NEOKW01_0591 [Nematocida sp. AWRm80]